jgi:hypothetical protein
MLRSMIGSTPVGPVRTGALRTGAQCQPKMEYPASVEDATDVLE